MKKIYEKCLTPPAWCVVVRPVYKVLPIRFGNGGAWQVVACSLAGFRATPFSRYALVTYCVKVVQHHNAIVAETAQIMCRVT